MKHTQLISCLRCARTIPSLAGTPHVAAQATLRTFLRHNAHRNNSEATPANTRILQAFAMALGAPGDSDASSSFGMSPTSEDAAGETDEDSASCRTELTELSDRPEAKRSRVELGWRERFFTSLDLPYDEMARADILTMKRKLASRRLDTRQEAANAISAVLGQVVVPFRADKRNPLNRDSQQLRQQAQGTRTLYFNFGSEPVEIGLRVKTRDENGPQRLHVLKDMTGILVTKTCANSILVSLLRGQKGKFWAFECQEKDVSKASSEGPPSEACSVASCSVSPERETVEDRKGEAEARLAQVRTLLPPLHQYSGLKGFIDEANSTESRLRLHFPSGAPSQTFKVDQLIELPADTSLRDRLTGGVRVWLRRGPGLSASAMHYLRAERKAVVRCLGYNAHFKKFLFSFDDRMEQHHMVSLTFNQTGIVQPFEEEEDASDSDPKGTQSSDDPKACSETSVDPQ